MKSQFINFTSSFSEFNVSFAEFMVEYARAAEAELAQSQTINPALVILNRQQIVKDDIRAWKRTHQAYKTWDNFKHDFCEVHLELR